MLERERTARGGGLQSHLRTTFLEIEPVCEVSRNRAYGASYRYG